MEAIQLLKSSAYRAGVDSQNDMLVKEMRYILAEIRNLSECFQVCGTRYAHCLNLLFTIIGSDKQNIIFANIVLCTPIFYMYALAFVLLSVMFVLANCLVYFYIRGSVKNNRVG